MSPAAPTTFAVVITSYQYRAYVEEAVRSVLAQTRPAKQVIVVDDGSRDGSVELLRQTFGNDPRVTLVFGENGGQLVAFQRGMAVVDADVACFLDADDRWEPGHLAAIGAVFDARRDVDMVFNDVQLFGNDTRRIAFEDRAADLGCTAVSTCLQPHWYGAPTSALALRAPMARRCLDLPAHMAATWRICADNVLVFGTSVLCGRKYFLPTGTVGYRIHGANGWGLAPPPMAAFMNTVRTRGLVAHYARLMGLDDPLACEAMLKAELRTKVDPPASEVRRYVRLALRGRAPLFKRLERALGLWKLGRALRAGAQSASANGASGSR